MTPPATRYAQVGDSYVAYQVVGDAPIDLVNATGPAAHLEVQWEHPPHARYLNRLASFSRLICFDRRGHGLSDPVDFDNMTLEHWMDDVVAVMDAAGSERAAILGQVDGGPMALLFAATHPERTSALVLISTSATLKRFPDYPWGMPEAVVERRLEESHQSFLGGGDRSGAWIMSDQFPNKQDSEHFLRMRRNAMSPRVARAFIRVLFETDVRDVLPTVRVPTLILHREGDSFRRVGHGRYLAEHIPDAKYVELPGTGGHPWAGDQDAVIGEIQEFLTGVRPVPESSRVLATVLFTDIVGSTEHAKRVGDKEWSGVLDRHDAIVEQQLQRHAGRKVNPTGDGIVATFDGPARAVRCAQAIALAVRELGIEARAGLHTGEIELREDDIGGIAVHIGQRISAMAAPGEVLVSRTVVDLVAGSGLVFTDRGVHALKSVGEWQLYAVES